MGSHFCGILRVREIWQVVIYKRKDSPEKKLPYSLLLFCCRQASGSRTSQPFYYWPCSKQAGDWIRTYFFAYEHSISIELKMGHVI